MNKELSNLKQTLNIEKNKKLNDNTLYKKRLDELNDTIEEIKNILKILNSIEINDLNILLLKYKNKILTNYYDINKKNLIKINKIINKKIKTIYKNSIEFYKDKNIDETLKTNLILYFNFINDIIIVLCNNVNIKINIENKNDFDNLFKFKLHEENNEEDVQENENLCDILNDDITEDETLEEINFDVNDYMYILVNCKNHKISLSNVNSLIKMLIEYNSVKYINTQLNYLKSIVTNKHDTDIFLKNFKTEYNIKNNIKSKFHDFINDLSDLNEKDLKKIVKAYKK